MMCLYVIFASIFGLIFEKVLAQKFGNSIKIYLDNPANNQLLLEKPSDVNEIDSHLPVKVLIHGWTENALRSYYQDMTQSYLSKGDYNIVRVDWSKIGDSNYISAYGYLVEVGEYVGKFIIQISQQRNISLKNFHIVGHSLGAHISGFAAKYVAKLEATKIGRISALDPAGPLFEGFSASRRLSSCDAIFVDVMHTDGGIFGYGAPLGTVDFYPNGGFAPQPGCQSTIVSVLQVLSQLLTFAPDPTASMFCSHTRSKPLFIEAITSNNRFKAVKCKSHTSFQNGNCREVVTVHYGDEMATNISGTYFFQTSAASPYGLG